MVLKGISKNESEKVQFDLIKPDQVINVSHSL